MNFDINIPTCYLARLSDAKLTHLRSDQINNSCRDTRLHYLARALSLSDEEYFSDRKHEDNQPFYVERKERWSSNSTTIFTFCKKCRVDHELGVCTRTHIHHLTTKNVKDEFNDKLRQQNEFKENVEIVNRLYSIFNNNFIWPKIPGKVIGLSLDSEEVKIQDFQLPHDDIHEELEVEQIVLEQSDSDTVEFEEIDYYNQPDDDYDYYNRCYPYLVLGFGDNDEAQAFTSRIFYGCNAPAIQYGCNREQQFICKLSPINYVFSKFKNLYTGQVYPKTKNKVITSYANYYSYKHRPPEYLISLMNDLGKRRLFFDNMDKIWTNHYFIYEYDGIITTSHEVFCDFKYISNRYIVEQSKITLTIPDPLSSPLLNTCLSDFTLGPC